MAGYGFRRRWCSGGSSAKIACATDRTWDEEFVGEEDGDGASTSAANSVVLGLVMEELQASILVA